MEITKQKLPSLTDLFQFSVRLRWFFFLQVVTLNRKKKNLQLNLWVVAALTLITSSLFYLIQSIMSYNGGAVMAMRGKNCVAIAADRRFGVQAQMVTTDFQKIFPMGERLYIGLAGLATDVQTV